MRRRAAVLVAVGLALGFWACDETIINVPRVTSLAIDPSEPTVFQGDELQLNAILSDDHGRTLKDRVVEWSIDDASVATVTTEGRLAGVAVGETTVRANSEGASASAPVVVPNRSPSVTLLAPDGAEPIVSGGVVQFRSVATDPEDGDLTDSAVTWTSSQDGQIGTDTVLAVALSTGDHRVRVTATDAHGATAADSVDLLVHEAPVVGIIDPVQGSVFAQGEAIVFRGSATDAEDGSLSGAAVVWTSSLDGAMGTDTVLSTSSLSIGQHTIRLEATDSHGATAVDSVEVQVSQNDPPAASISEPASSSVFTVGASVTFRGTASDTEDGPLSGAAVVWTSSFDGQIGTDTVFTTSALSAGEHLIRMEVTDSHGATGRDSIWVEINQPPVAVITAPGDGVSFQEGDPIEFHATADDPEDGSLSGSAVTWTSNVDGQIGTDTMLVTSALSAGEHLIALEARDQHGATAADTILVIINGAPVVTIDAPPDSTTVVEGDTIQFSGSATDPEEGTLTGASLVWTSSLDGQLATGTTFTTSNLSVGEHRIRLTATDSDGLTGADSVLVTVNAAPTVAILEPAHGSAFIQDEPVTFRASAYDEEDGLLSASAVVWTSTLDAQIGTDTVLTTGSLSPGVHTIVVTATDSDGALVEDSIALTIKSFEEAIAGSWGIWWEATGSLTMSEGSAGAWLSATAFQHSSSAANFGMEQYSRISRIATINDTTDAHYGFLAFPYEALTQAAWEASRGLRALLVDGVNLGAGDQERAIAFGKFVLGIAHGYLAMLYEAAPLIDENTLTRSPPDFTGFDALDDAALSYLDEAIAYANSAAFTVPEEWMWVSGGVSNDRLARIAHSFKARIMAAVPRTPSARAGVDWAGLASEAQQGVTIDLEYTFSSASDRTNQTLYYQIAPEPWSHLNYFVLAMADTSGNYLEWMGAPVADRHPSLNNDPNQPFLIHTPDQRFPQGTTLDGQIASPGARFIALDSSALAWVYPDRGTWRWSYYRDARDATATARDGTSPDLTVSEMELLLAEANLRMGDNTSAAALINETRTAAGLPATDATGTNSVCVPRLPDGTCGGLWEMLKYEKRLVASHNNGHMSAGWYFDSRGWGDLMEGTILNLPVPAHIAIENGLTVENYGGVGGVWGAPVGTYGY